MINIDYATQSEICCVSIDYPFHRPDRLQEPVSFEISSADLLEATLCEEFGYVVADTQVESALIGYGGGVQDRFNN